MIHLDHLPPAGEEAWWTLFEMADQHGTDSWMVIGGQMMHLLAAEHGVSDVVRPTTDADVVVNVRVLQRGTEMLSTWLLDQDFRLEGPGPDGIGHRFVRPASGGPGEVIVDVLAPEGLGDRTNVYTVRPARTVSAPGTVQAFERSNVIEVAVSGTGDGTSKMGAVRRPGLLGALVLKAATTTIPTRAAPERDWQDAALLLSVIPDPMEAANDCGQKDLKRLSQLRPLTDQDHVGWANLDADARRRGIAALDFLIG